MLSKLNTFFQAATNTASALLKGPSKNLNEMHESQISRFRVFSNMMSQFNYTKNQIDARKQYWCTQAYFLRSLVENNLETFKTLTQSEIHLDKLNFSKMLKELCNALDQREKVLLFLQILKQDSEVIKTQRVEAGSYHAYTPGVHLFQGDVIKLIKKLISDGQRIVIDDAPNSHRDGATKYSKGSVEELLSRYTDGWKMVLDFEDVHQRNYLSELFAFKDQQPSPIDVLDYQQRYLKMMLNIVIKLLDNSESYLESKEFLQDLFFSFPREQKPDEFLDSLPIYFGMQNNVYEVPIQGFTSTRNFLDTNKINTVESIFADTTRSLTPLTVVSYAAPDRRMIEISPLDKRCTSNSILQHPEEKGVLEKMLSEGINNQCKQAIDLAKFYNEEKINQPIAVVFIMPGCGAFGNPAEEVAECLFSTIKNNYDELNKYNITCYVAEYNSPLFDLMHHSCEKILKQSAIPFCIERDSQHMHHFM